VIHQDASGLEEPHGEHAVVLSATADDRGIAPVAAERHRLEKRARVVVCHPASVPDATWCGPLG
jgi:hypothetical protein